MGIPVFVPLRSALNAGPLDLQRPHALVFDITDVFWLPLKKWSPRSEYLRKLLLEKEITNRIEVVADMDELRRLLNEYGKIGSNLNQIARYFNTGGESSAEIKDEIRQKTVERGILYGRTAL